MIISIDFDDTFTRDPEGWKAFIELMKGRGHTVICVTARPAIGWLATEAAKQLSFGGDSPIIPIIFAGNEWKKVVAEKFGYKVDVWIDDTPNSIEKQYILGG